MITPASPLESITPRSSLTSEQMGLREAAQGFEAIMLRQLLASARASSMAEQTPFTGSGLEQFQTMLDDHFADIASKSGTLGIAASIEAQLSAHLRQAPASSGREEV
ncbi:rod-binding protein [Altererythrobacter lutimaris]|uniref:Rod-binding protein n=1 Tax=Altererythrobacter lutimaris TaxID=2743979 RepID=A0A850HA37_9SPHN|nr:rod-binding protein [Altererythrobacter lutimaris]NVE93308.1 rod-binding protein [Altererythrobacter lutimaris]